MIPFVVTAMKCEMALPVTRPKVAVGTKSAKSLVRDVVAKVDLLWSLPPDAVEAELASINSRDLMKFVRVTRVITGFVNKPAQIDQAAKRKRKLAEPSQLPEVFADQAVAARADLVAKKQVITAADLMDRLDFTRQALSKAVLARRFFTVDVGANRMYPAFFADPNLDRRKLERIAKDLGELPGWSKWVFFTTPKASLGGVTPLDALKRGRYSEARRAAIGFLDHGSCAQPC